MVGWGEFFQDRYRSWDLGVGAEIERGERTFESLEGLGKKGAVSATPFLVPNIDTVILVATLCPNTPNRDGRQKAPCSSTR